MSEPRLNDMRDNLIAPANTVEVITTAAKMAVIIDKIFLLMKILSNGLIMKLFRCEWIIFEVLCQYLPPS